MTSSRNGLSVFPANRGVLRHTLFPKVVPGSSDFQYSLRIVGFCDPRYTHPSGTGQNLSVFPANRGVLRHARVRHSLDATVTFSIPCESWGSATRRGRSR